MTAFDRRQFLGGTLAVAVGFPGGAPGEAQTRDLAGFIPYGGPDWVYQPIRVPAGVRRLTVTLTATGVPGTTLRLITDQGVRMNVPLPESGAVVWTTTPRNSRYVRAEVRRGDAMVALTNPVFLGA